MPFQKELLARQCPVPGREGRPAFHGMLMAQGLLGLRVGGSGQPCWQTQPPTLGSPITPARGTPTPTEGRPLPGLGSPKALARQGGQQVPPTPAGGHCQPEGALRTVP